MTPEFAAGPVLLLSGFAVEMFVGSPLRVHGALLEEERIRYEREYGRIVDGARYSGRRMRTSRRSL